MFTYLTMVAFIITTMSSLVLLVLTSTTAQAASPGLTSGLTLTVWDNNGREGAPVLTKVIPTMHYDFASATELLNISSNNPTGAFSADIEGTIEFTTSGVFEFYCNFTRFATAFVCKILHALFAFVPYRGVRLAAVRARHALLSHPITSSPHDVLSCMRRKYLVRLRFDSWAASLASSHGF